ncbi:S-adenosylmethionine synthase isoform type-1 [Cucumispora dikerogammari]|nr:S-adenosylmethionine synthase isoform type-1 [Cucumispora dikerogammari]
MTSNENFIFTSESVGRGHPDKVCDQISDSLVDEYMKNDPEARCAIETVAAYDTIMVCGEIHSKAQIDISSIVSNTLKCIGYDPNDFKIINKICKQSLELFKLSGSESDNCGAGDQGIMFGYATNETEESIPLTLLLSHQIVKKIDELSLIKDFLGNDCKSQVTVEYSNVEGGLVPKRVHTIVVSTQHSVGTDMEFLREFIIEAVIKAVVPLNLLKDTRYIIQPSGSFVLGGPKADSGLTGRKIIVDTYGGFGSHGGGSFSGKDWTKVDRSGAYAARWIALSLVKAKICKRISLQISYAVGIAKPLSINVETFNSSNFSNSKIIEIINNNFDLRPAVIMKDLDLKKPIYAQTACYGHFGRSIFNWEKPKVLFFE